MIKKILGAALGMVLMASSVQAAEKMRISLQLPLKSHLGQNLLVFEKEVEAQLAAEHQQQVAAQE